MNQLKQELQGPLQEEAKSDRLNFFTQFEEYWPEIFARSLRAALFDKSGPKKG